MSEAVMAAARGFTLKTVGEIDQEGSDNRIPSPSIGMSVVTTSAGPRVTLILVDGSEQASCALFDAEEFAKLHLLMRDTALAFFASGEVKH